MGAAELAVMIPLVAVMGGILVAALKILKSGSDRGSREMYAEETRLIQDIYHGLLKLEERVEALETLLLDRDRKGGVSQ